MTSSASTVAEYLASLPEDRRKALKKIRTLVRKALPRCKETMEYGMPSYFWKGHPVFAYASQSGYMSLYVCDAAVIAAFKGKLGKLDCGKGCIRFKAIEALPLDVTAAILAKAARRATSGEFVYKGASRSRTAAPA